MTKTVSTGTSSTAQAGITPLTFPVSPLNYDADFGVLEEGPGKIVYTDVTAPQDQPSTLRIATRDIANVYAGTSIDPSVFLPSRKGTDTIVEVREVASVVDSTDATFLQQFPSRFALTMSLPDTAYVTDDFVLAGVARVVAALFAQGDQTAATGIADLLRRVARRS